MKKIFTSLMVLATLAMVSVSCTKEINNQTEEQVAGKMKTVTVKTDIATRTTLDSNHENIVWSSGDKISIFNDADNTNLEKVYAAGEDLVVSVPAATKEIYAHYPYYNGNTKGPSEVSVYIPNSQNQTNPGELNGYNYPMVAKGTVREETVDNETVYKAIISLYPVASALALNIYNTNLSGEETVKSVTVTPAAANTGFAGSQTTDLTKENIKYTTAASSNPITVTLTNPLTLGSTKPADKQKFDGQIYVCLAKQSYANVKFEIQTNKGTYTITSSETPFDCVNNDFVPVNINLAKAAEFEEAAELSGTYVILAEEKVEGVSTLYAMANTHEDNDNRLDEVVFVDGTTSTENRSIVWNISKVGDNYAITDVYGKYLTASTSNDANVGTSATVCSIIENSDGTYSVRQNSRYLSRNDANQGFAFYGNTGQNCRLSLVKIQLQAPPTLSWGEDAILLEADDETEHEISLNVFDATSVNVKVYEEDEETEVNWILAEYADGKVSYMAEANTGEIRKAVMIATATNDYGTVTAKINITQKPDNSHVTKGATWSYTFTNTDFAEANTAYSGTYNDLSLSFTSTLKKNSFDANGRGVQFGAAKGEFTITVSGYDEGVESIKLVVSSNAANNTISATVDNKQIGEEITIANGDNQEIEFKSTSLMQGGNIVFSINDKTKSVYLKSITINPEAPAPATVTGISVEDYTESFTASETGSYSFDGKVYAVYSDNSKVELSSDDYSITGSVDLTTAGTYTLTVSATIDGIAYSEQITVTVNPAGSDTVVYTLTPAATGNNTAPHNSYTAEATTTIDGIGWAVTGNSYMVPWRIGGKAIDKTDRTIYSTTALNKSISSIEITHGAASGIIVNSMTVIVSKNSDFSSPVSTLTPSFAANSTVTVNRPDGIDWSSCYYKIVYNVTVSGSSNKFLEFTKAEFIGK